MDNRKYRFAMKFAVERDVIIEAEDLVEAMALITNVSPEMLLPLPPDPPLSERLRENNKLSSSKNNGISNGL